MNQSLHPPSEQAQDWEPWTGECLRDSRHSLPKPAWKLRHGGKTDRLRSHKLKEHPVPDPRSLTPSPGHWPPPHKSRPDPRTATPNVGTVRILGLAGGSHRPWSLFCQIPKSHPLDGGGEGYWDRNPGSLVGIPSHQRKEIHFCIPENHPFT